MSRTNIAIVVAAAGILLAVGNAQTGKGGATPTQSTAGTAGRYQLMTGEYLYNGEATVKQQGVFRIDSATGKTSLYTVGLNPQGQLVEYWHQIDETLKPVR